VGSRDINASVARANIGAFVAAAFIRSEPNAAVASVTNVTSIRTRPGCVAKYRAILILPSGRKCPRPKVSLGTHGGLMIDGRGEDNSTVAQGAQTVRGFRNAITLRISI
jgi:hypothetical protein